MELLFNNAVYDGKNRCLYFNGYKFTPINGIYVVYYRHVDNFVCYICDRKYTDDYAIDMVNPQKDIVKICDECNRLATRLEFVSPLLKLSWQYKMMHYNAYKYITNNHMVSRLIEINHSIGYHVKMLQLYNEALDDTIHDIKCVILLYLVELLFCIRVAFAKIELSRY